MRTVCLILFTEVLLSTPVVRGEEANAPIKINSYNNYRRVLLAASGDLLLHRSVVHAAQAFEREGGWRRSLSGFCNAIDEDAVGIVNIETPLTDSVVPLRNGDHPVLGAPPEVAGILASCGVDIASVANNHALDQDSEGLRQTIEALGFAGVIGVGAGASPEEAYRARILERNGLRIAFLAATGPMNQRHQGRGSRLHVARLREEAALLDAVEAARNDGADLVVVLLHWMWDYRTGPRRYERELARRLIERGADVLLGAGPHVLHSVDRLPSPRGEAVVAWSLGNLISGMGMRWRPGWHAPSQMHPVSVLPGTRDAIVLNIDVEVGASGDIHFPTIRATPLWTFNNWLTRPRPADFRHDIRVLPFDEVDELTRRTRLPEIRNALGEHVTVEP